MNQLELTTLCYIEKEEQYLMLHRVKKENDINEGKWIGVGGHLKPGETVDACVVREAFEETGLTIENPLLRGVIHFTCDDVEEMMFVYTANQYSGVMQTCDEGVLSWVDKKDVLKLDLWKGDLIFLSQLMSSNEFFYYDLNYDKYGTLLDNKDKPYLIQEPEAVWKHRKMIAALGTKALIVTGRHSAEKNGSLSDVKAVLEQEKIDYCIYNEIEENPSVETIRKARDFGLANHVDFVIGIGGGSPLDAAKAIALLLNHPDQDENYLFETGNAVDNLPVVAIPTTCGTGSEATAVSVLTRPAIHTKGSIPYRIFPDLSLVDKKYLRTASQSILVNTALDALSHLLESGLNVKATELSRCYTFAGLSVWAKSKDVLTGEREATEEDYRNMMVASTLGGMAIAGPGTTIPHALSYQLTLDEGWKHGLAVNYFTPGYLETCIEHEVEDAKKMLSTIGFASVEELGRFIWQIAGPLEPNPENLDITYEKVVHNEAKMSLAPYDITPADLRNMVDWYQNHKM